MSPLFGRMNIRWPSTRSSHHGDVIDIPERIGVDEYVLRLTDSTDNDAHIRATVGAHVLTDSLKDDFASAISLISDAIRKNTSRGAYLVRLG